MYVAHSDKVTIAKVDATLNDVPDEIQGFPTIKLFAAGSKDAPVDYTGSRTVEDLAAFIRDHGTYKIDAYADEDTEMSDVTSQLTKVSETMQHQAPAATKSAESAASKGTESAESAASKGSKSAESAASGASSVATDAASKASDAASDATESIAEATESAKAGVVEGVKNVVEALVGGDDSLDDHDEL